MKKILFILLLFITSGCFANNLVTVDAKKKAMEFTEAIQTKNYSKAYQLTNGHMRWRFDGMVKNRTIKNEDDFISLAPFIFKNLIINDVTPLDANLECCQSRNAVLTGNSINKKVLFYFQYDGTPNVLINSTMALPSFTCSSAVSSVEVAICQSHSLSVQDQSLHEVYKNAQRFFTGEQQQELKRNQIQFIRQRNVCDSDTNCIKSFTDKRIKLINKQISLEYKNLDHLVTTKVNSPLEGNWVPNGEIKHASTNYPYFDENYAFLVSISAKNGVVKIDRQTNSLDDKENVHIHNSCYVEKVQHYTYANVYYQTAYKKNYYGRSGQDFTQLPFAVNYTTFELSHKQNSSSSCGIIIRTGVNHDVFFYADNYIDEPLVGEGYLLMSVN
ncbi:lysozyme inhibitor LprI family protein [Vibrio ezurae]|nr:hypothetical protein [Vibrio ezurae]